MNAFKKELAGMLLDDTQSHRAMEKIVADIDEVFTNLSMQIDHEEGMTIWFSFFMMLAMELSGKITETCLTDDQPVYDSVKTMIDTFILIEKVAESQFEDMLLDGVNNNYKDYYYTSKESLLK